MHFYNPILVYPKWKYSDEKKGANKLKDYRNANSSLSPTVENLSQAIFTVNRHAKTAPNPKFLYNLKATALKKLIKEGKAKKIGLHFSDHPRFSQQQSDVLVVCGKYSYHLPPTKNDFKQLPHLGKLDGTIRNPKSSIPLKEAKSLLITYTGINEDFPGARHHKKKYNKPVFKKLGDSYFS
ncbi:hypothetical protein J9303_15495 [Bacillaceae bacterium Marseille-Q3522]|nr:hypothetical protein [Bacillaceae bacterium Marseille-Q3522]